MIRILLSVLFSLINNFISNLNIDFDLFNTFSALLTAAAPTIRTIYSYITFFIDPSTIIIIVSLSIIMILTRIVFAIVNLIYP